MGFIFSKSHTFFSGSLLDATFMVPSPQNIILYINFGMLILYFPSQSASTLPCVTGVTCPMFQLKNLENEMKKKEVCPLE